MLDGAHPCVQMFKIAANERSLCVAKLVKSACLLLSTKAVTNVNKLKGRRLGARLG